MSGKRVIALVPDLMDRSRFGSVNVEVTFVRTADELIAAATATGEAEDEGRNFDLVVVDLARPGAIEAASRLNGLEIIGFASHVDNQTIASAKSAGIEQVLPRSRFFSQIVTILDK